ncbi:hypothetical protein [Streptomyces chiangmaiensis]|uniref:Uncharacterized protein n=1 Tax=Streptomyces chiangmaiensis TaxID=766497 RepID=A0ABU7FMV2_9ACTN|nr:hypothetical protein [Streptomyces chiangmaiensis]MED7825432.1 hypothetical protein [Streptomyces chiangmaiensis]
MPQESAGCAGVRKPALALLVGLVLMLLAHAVSCAAHPAEGHAHATAVVAAAVHEEAGTDSLRSAWEMEDCALAHGADGHPEHGIVCCDPADWPADTRVPAGTLLLAFTLFALLSLRRRVVDAEKSGAPPGGGDSAAVPISGGSHLLRLVCVSRT